MSDQLQTALVTQPEELAFSPGALTSIRILTGYSQAELARCSGLSQGHISELERGDKTPRPGTVKKLAVALGVPMPTLLGGNSSST